MCCLLLHTAVKVKLRAGVTLYAEPSDSGWLQINKYAVIKNALAQQCVDNKRSVMDVKKESFSFSFLFKRVMLLYTHAQRPVNNDTKPGILAKRRNRFLYAIAIHLIGLQAFNVSYFLGDDDSKMMTRLNQIFLHLSASGYSRKIFRAKNIDSSERQNLSSISFITSRMLYRYTRVDSEPCHYSGSFDSTGRKMYLNCLFNIFISVRLRRTIDPPPTLVWFLIL